MRGGGNGFALGVGIDHALLPLLDDLLVIGFFERQRAHAAAGKDVAGKPGGETGQQAVADDAADEQTAPLAGGGQIGVQTAV